MLLERYGVALSLGPEEAIAIEESPSAAVSFAVRGFLPDRRQPPLSVLAVREKWLPIGRDAYERWEYEYELLDHERRFRRAFHLHDAEYFVRRFYVAVHEHCERPIGVISCAHYEGSPIRDGLHAVEALVAVWADSTVLDCSAMRCLG